MKKGQTIGIIEAMKLLNEVEADQDGIVQVLLRGKRPARRIRPAALVLE